MKNLVKKMSDRINRGFKIEPNYLTKTALTEVYGKSHVRVENHLGIIKYTADTIRLRTNECIVEIVGRDLSLEGMLTDEAFISGLIHSVNFIDEGCQ